MNAKSSATERLVRTHHWVHQWAPPLILLASGLATTLAVIWVWHPTFAPVAQWKQVPFWWGGGLAAAWVGAMVVWWARRRSLLRSAMKLDEALNASSRLETATALVQADDALARAQREETEQFLGRQRVSYQRRALLIPGFLVLLLLLAHVGTLVCWTRSLNSDARDAAPLVSAESKIPEAVIQWKSPESETTAVAIEEVPLAAVEYSTTGLKEVVLEVAVNGVTRLTQPLPAEDCKAPGRHSIKASICFDQLEVKTFDVVSYHLRAMRIDDRKLPPTISPVQFVQIRPFRQDVFVCTGGDKPGQCFNYVAGLKAAQLRLMKENFTLAHAEINREHADWKEWNTRIADEQNELCGRAAEVITVMTTNNYPPEILKLVRGAQPLMADACGNMREEKNVAALASQGKALGLLTEVERYLRNSINLSQSSGGPPKVSDPFDAGKNAEIKKRSLTRAGKIDQLATQQAQLAGDLAESANPSRISAPGDETGRTNSVGSTPESRQAQIKREISELLNDDALEPEARKHLQEGHTLAALSQERLEQKDVSAAQEPAAEAARELRQTAAILRHAGEKTARNELAEALRQLAAGAGTIRRSTQINSEPQARSETEKAADHLKEAARRLTAAGRAQEEQGRTQTAKQLNEMSAALENGDLKQMMEQLQTQPRNNAGAEALARKLDQLAENAAEQQSPTAPSPQEMAQLAEKLERTRTNLERLAGSCNNPGGTGTGGAPGVGGIGSLDGSLTPSSPGKSALGSPERRQQFGGELMAELREGTLAAMGMIPKTAELAELRKVLGGSEPIVEEDIPAVVLRVNPPLQEVIRLLRAELTIMRRSYQLTAEDLELAPPAYRVAVADYFEQLSRDYQPAADRKTEVEAR